MKKRYEKNIGQIFSLFLLLLKVPGLDKDMRVSKQVQVNGEIDRISAVSRNYSYYFRKAVKIFDIV